MPNIVNITMSPCEWGLLLTLSLLWGGSFFFVGIAVNELPPLTIVFLRVSIAAIVLNFVLRIIGRHSLLSLRVWLALFGMGLLNNVIPFILICLGSG